MKFPLFVAALCIMASLNVSAASTLASEGMITTDDYATFLNTLGEEASGISEFLAVEGAMHQQDCYDEKMAEDVGSSCLMRRGEPGNYFYECTGGTSSTPLHFMSALDAELYCRWNNSALAPSPHASSERDPLLKTNITTFPIQIAHDGTQGTSLHQAMGEEEIVEPCILETLEEIIGLVVVGGALGGNSLHARAHERERAPLTPEFNNSLRLAQSTREISEETHQIDGLKGFENSRTNLKNLMSNIPNNLKGPSTSDMGDTNPTNTDAQPSLKMSPKELEAYQLETYGRTVEHVANTPACPSSSRTTYRLTPSGWEKREAGKDLFKPTDQFDPNNLGDGTWKEVGPVPSLLSNTCDPIAEIIKNHSRSDGIAKKIASYQQRLDAPETPLTPEERAKFTNLITVLNAAKKRQ